MAVFLQHVFRSDDEAPPRPDGACGCEGEVLRKGEVLGGASEIAYSSQDKGPLLKDISCGISLATHGYIERTFITGALTQC